MTSYSPSFADPLKVVSCRDSSQLEMVLVLTRCQGLTPLSSIIMELPFNCRGQPRSCRGVTGNRVSAKEMFDSKPESSSMNYGVGAIGREGLCPCIALGEV